MVTAMATTSSIFGHSFIREVELRLLRCTLPSPTSPPPPPSPPHPQPLGRVAASLVAAVEAGDYAAALVSAAPYLFPDVPVSGYASAEQFYADAAATVAAFLRGDGDEGAGFECRCAVVLCAAAAALLAFTQQNVTGPPGRFSSFPFWTLTLEDVLGSNVGEKWDAWASNQLASVGSHVRGKFSLLQYIVYAELLFTNIKKGAASNIWSICWWLCRVSIIHQNILDELSSSLFDQVQVYKNDMLCHFGELEEISSYWGPLLSEGEGSTVVSAACLEAAISEYKYGRVDDSRLHLDRAQEACGLRLFLTGILGFRTIHQVDAKPQFVLVANTSEPASGERQFTEPTGAQNDIAALKNTGSSIPDESDEFCDILRIPRLVQNGDVCVHGSMTDSSTKVPLTAIQQAAVLAQCLHLSRRSRADELSGSEMAAYIESIDSQHHSYYAVRSLCDVLRVRWESTRSRTKQRALLMIENLVNDVSKEIPVVAQRIKLAFGVDMPTISALRKEYSELLVSCGIVGEALEIFKDLELWDNLIYCYRLLGKGPDAVSLINARLSAAPNDPRLWCSLGDVTNSDSHYKKALEVSNNKSARAMRSLARSAYNRNDFDTSKTYWESALAINPLYPDGWFSYGTAAWKAKDFEKAVEAFSRAVQIDPENGEAWNNIACLHMMGGKSQAAAYAFKEAVKFKRNSWEVWENFSKVALDTGNIRQTLEAFQMVLTLSSNKRVDVDILDKVMSVLEGKTSTSVIIQETESTSKASEWTGQPESTYKESLQSDHFSDILGDILHKIVRNGNAEIWGLYARWHKTKGNLTMCSEALLKQVRSLQGSGLWHDQKKFTKYAQASLQLCKVYMEIASSTGSRRELLSAEMHLKASLKQATDFSNTDEYKALDSCLNEIRNLLAAA